MLSDLNNDSQILDLIEHNLSTEEAESLSQQLDAASTNYLSTIHAMQQDRAHLANDPEPQLEGDLIDSLESVLSKPMLLGAMPDAPISAADYRARHRREASIFVRSSKMLLAAGLMLTMTAGMYFLYDMVLNNSDDFDGGNASTGPRLVVEDVNSNDVAENVELDRAQPSSIHHWDAINAATLVKLNPAIIDPSTTDAETAIAEVESADDLAITLATGERAIILPFAIQLHDHKSTDIDRLVEIIHPSRSMAMVANFTASDVEAAWEQMVVQQRNRTNRQRPTMADWKRASQSNSRQPMNTMIRNEIRQVAGDIELGKHLAGVKKLGVQPEQQFQFGEQGAAYTMTIATDELSKFLQQLNIEFANRCELRPMLDHTVDAEDNPSSQNMPAPGNDWQRWKNWQQVITLANQARLDTDATFVIIPIELLNNTK